MSRQLVATIPVTLFGLATLIMLVTPAHAQIVGGSNIITNADVTTLSGYLGEGPLQLTNIFSHVSGDGSNSATFHTAVNGKGRTFSVEKVTSYTKGSGAVVPFTAIIGGYDPLSWSSSVVYNIDTIDAGRTAFIYNLTTGGEQKQNLINQGSVGSGQYQTYNTYGPTFGGGYDLYVDASLNGGYTGNYSYGGMSSTTDILGNPTGFAGTLGLVYSNLEVFTIAPAAATPEPGSIALFLGMTLTGAAFLRRKGTRG